MSEMSDQDNTLPDQNNPESPESKESKKELAYDREGNVSRCWQCDKPLGQESRDLGYIVCHAHRTCSKCGTNCQAVEIQWCYENDYPIAHSRCLSLNLPKEVVPTDLMNMLTKLVWPDPQLSPETNVKTAELTSEQLFARQVHQQSIDEAYVTMKMLQAAAAIYSFKLQKDRTKIEKDIDDRERKKQDSVEVERKKKSLTKSDKKAAGKDAPAITKREKLIKDMMAMGFTREMAEKIQNEAHQSNKN
jgi:hypothetical protein